MSVSTQLTFTLTKVFSSCTTKLTYRGSLIWFWVQTDTDDQHINLFLCGWRGHFCPSSSARNKDTQSSRNCQAFIALHSVQIPAAWRIAKPKNANFDSNFIWRGRSVDKVFSPVTLWRHTWPFPFVQSLQICFVRSITFVCCHWFNEENG